MFFPFDDAKVRRNPATAMDEGTKNTKNSIILDGNQETVLAHSAVFGVFMQFIYSSTHAFSLAFQSITLSSSRKYSHR